jgi:hypothetical protein
MDVQHCIWWLEVNMSRSAAAVVCFVFVVASANAQTNPQAMVLAGVIDCIREATATSSVEHDSNVLVFSCTATKAKTLYNFLGSKIRAEVVLDRNGKFENRQFGNNACYHQVQDQSGKTADDFRCDLIIAIGDALSE